MKGVQVQPLSATTRTSVSSSRGEAKRSAPPGGGATPRAAPSLAQILRASVSVMRVHQRPRSGTSMQRRRRAVRTVRAKLELVRNSSFTPTSTTLPRSPRKMLDCAQCSTAHFARCVNCSSRSVGSAQRNALDVCMAVYWTRDVEVAEHGVDAQRPHAILPLLQICNTPCGYARQTPLPQDGEISTALRVAPRLSPTREHAAIPLHTPGNIRRCHAARRYSA